MSSLLQISDLQVEFNTDNGTVLAVDGLNLRLDAGETLGLVGESGSGKSVTSLAIMGLLPDNARTSGKITYQGESLLNKTEKELGKIRGNRISMIFQEPMTSLNPVFTVENQLFEVFKLHQGGSKKDIQNKIVQILELVGIPNSKRRMREFPHQMSGGMRQRIMIAMALACNPDVLIADEPTTALDVTIQAQILGLMRDLQNKLGTGILMITHDLGVVAQVAHRVAVMYAGQVVEAASVNEIFGMPRHPYTRGLLNTIPLLQGDGTRLHEIPGMVPSLSELPPGCRFHPRCDSSLDICSKKIPPVISEEEKRVRCWLYE